MSGYDCWALLIRSYCHIETVELVKRSTSDRRRVFYVGFLGRLLFKLSATGGEEEGFFESVLIRCHWSLKLAPYGVHIQRNPALYCMIELKSPSVI